MNKCSGKNKYRFSVSKRKSKEIYHFFSCSCETRFFIFILRALTYKYDNNSKFIRKTYFCNKDVFYYFFAHSMLNKLNIMLSISDKDTHCVVSFIKRDEKEQNKFLCVKDMVCCNKNIQQAANSQQPKGNKKHIMLKEML